MKNRDRANSPDDFQCLTVDPANPTGPRVHAVIPSAWYLRLYKYIPVDYENIRCVKTVLENPRRIFYGVREYNEGGWCMTGRPAEWHVRPNVVAAFPANLVFAVYLNPRMRVYEARAEDASPDDEFSPINWKNRYQGKVQWSGIS